MKFTPDAAGTARLTPELASLLRQLRCQDGFSPARYVDAKTHVLNEYLASHSLKSCVVAVSGGIDSALVLALAAAAAKRPGSPVKEIVPVLLPVFDAEAATNQADATSRGTELCAALGLEPVTIDLTRAHATTKGLVDDAMGVRGQGWAAGQLVAYQRTPALYYVTSLQNQKGRPGVLLGTTNYDEGAYLGYFGKASDGLVDVQPISDLHKSQVYAVAAYLGVPASILDVVPNGDMYDGRTDEDVFGASYDFVELFLRAKRNPEQVRELVSGIGAASQQQYAAQAANLEDLHHYNSHKYLGASPAVHLDLWDWSFEGSWKYFVWRSPSGPAERQ